MVDFIRYFPVKKNIYRLILGTFTLPLFSFAASPVTELANLLNTMRTLQADFSQVVLGKNSALRQNSRGHVVIAKPNRFRWDIVAPSALQVIADGRHLIVYNVDLQQATVQNLQRAIANTPALILSNDATTLLKKYSVSKKVGTKNLSYRLQAREPNQGYYFIELNFQQGKISSMRLQDNLHQASTVTFSKVLINAPINQKRFIFQKPPQVDLINNN